LLTIINDILDFSKIEAGKLEIEPIPFDWQMALTEVADLLAPKAEEKGLEMLLSFDPDAPRHVVGDAGRIRQIVLNLAGNAIKFTEKGHVLIEVACLEQTEEEANLKITVHDTGIGLNQEARAKLFQSFSQADASTTRKYGGTGLGLIICRQLVEAMGGEIGMESAPGEGSVFWFSLRLPKTIPSTQLPRVDLDGLRTLVADDVDDTLEFALRVLVVEDNIVNQLVARRMLEKLGCRVDVAANGVEAVENWVQLPYDIVFMDCQMPEMDGYTATGIIREREGGERHTPIVAMTANAMEGDRDYCMASGMDDYVAKPVSKGDLVNALEKWGAAAAAASRPLGSGCPQ
jgi:CheY-like chemotaxis protein